MKVDKAFEKKMDEKFKAWWEPFIETNVTLREVIKDELSISCIRWLFHIGFSLGSDAGAEYGGKQARIKALDWVKNEIKELPEGGVDSLLIYRIDTELKKLRSE